MTIRNAATSIAAGRAGQLADRQVDLDRGAEGETPRDLRECPRQAQLVEGRRTQSLDDSPQLGDRRAELGPKGIDVRGDGGRRVELARDHVEPEEVSCQCRPQPVVQVASEPAPFLLASEHEPLDCPLEISPEATGMQHTAEVPGEVIEQPAISSAQRRGGRAVSEGADRFSVRGKRERRRVRQPGSGDERSPAITWPSSSQMATSSRPRPAELAADIVEQAVDVDRRLEALAEVRQHVVRLVPPSERQAIHRSLQRVTQRCEEQQRRSQRPPTATKRHGLTGGASPSRPR